MINLIAYSLPITVIPNLQSTTNIPTLIMNEEYAENDLQKANMLNAFFLRHRQPLMTQTNLYQT